MRVFLARQDVLWRYYTSFSVRSVSQGVKPRSRTINSKYLVASGRWGEVCGRVVVVLLRDPRHVLVGRVVMPQRDISAACFDWSGRVVAEISAACFLIGCGVAERSEASFCRGVAERSAACFLLVVVLWRDGSKA